VPVIRKSGDDSLVHDVAFGEAGLWVRFDAQPWLAGIDFGYELDRVTCDATEACTDSRAIEADSPTYRGLHNALVLGQRPTFSWSSP
jgi:hypothetical protein